jgi:hypothetical protein
MLYVQYVIIPPVSDVRTASHKFIQYLSTTHKKKIPYSVHENLSSHITNVLTRCVLTSRKTVTTRTKNVSTVIRKFYSRAELNKLYYILFCLLFKAESVSLQTWKLLFALRNLLFYTPKFYSMNVLNQTRHFVTPSMRCPKLENFLKWRQ